MNIQQKILAILLLLCGGSSVMAQIYTYTDSMQWKSYDDFNNVFLDKKKYIYRDHSARANAVDRWNGAAAIWCQAIFYDMVVNAYRRADAEGDATRRTKYRLLHSRIYNGMKSQYVNFNFDDCNTNTGWFVYDDIMWWTCALARAYDTFKTREYLNHAERSFLRVWYGSAKVGDDGSYADPARGLGGGMFWEWQPIDAPKPHQKGDFRSACINFPTVIAACLLSQLVSEGRQEQTVRYPTAQPREWYLERAKEVYEWAYSTLVQNGRVADGIHGGGPEFKDHLYNQGTCIGASCMLYLITGEYKYLSNARATANYVFRSMCTNNLLPLETGIEQGVYAAIFAQYMHLLIYDCGQKSFLTNMKRNIQRGFLYMDPTRGIFDGNFLKRGAEGAQVESYNASSLPAMALLFPMEDSQTGVELLEDDTAAWQDFPYVFDLKGRRVGESAQSLRSQHLSQGIYIQNRRKYLVP